MAGPISERFHPLSTLPHWGRSCNTRTLGGHTPPGVHRAKFSNVCVRKHPHSVWSILCPPKSQGILRTREASGSNGRHRKQACLTLPVTAEGSKCQRLPLKTMAILKTQKRGCLAAFIPFLIGIPSSKHLSSRKSLRTLYPLGKCRTQAVK